jgi:hypothetical protein
MGPFWGGRLQVPPLRTARDARLVRVSGSPCIMRSSGHGKHTSGQDSDRQGTTTVDSQMGNGTESGAARFGEVDQGCAGTDAQLA